MPLVLFMEKKPYQKCPVKQAHYNNIHNHFILTVTALRHYMLVQGGSRVDKYLLKWSITHISEDILNTAAGVRLLLPFLPLSIKGRLAPKSPFFKANTPGLGNICLRVQRP